MIVCSECFQDPEIKSIISKVNNFGQCPICGTDNVAIYDTEKQFELSPLFEQLISVYTPIEDFPEDIVIKRPRMLPEVIKGDWNIFSEGLSNDSIREILMSLAPSVVDEFPALFSSPVDILEKYDEEYLKEHSILHSANWSDFVNAIKHKNRFHTSIVDVQRLREYCMQISELLIPGKQRYYRGRIAKDKNGYSPKNMGAPPADLSPDGRINSAGISRLYLTDNRITTFHEIRAAEYDYVTIGTFKLIDSIRVVDLSRIGKISPFGEDVDITVLAINRDHLQRINQEMAHPMRRGDSVLDYLPTQYIGDFIMSIQDEDGNPVFDGIRYQSAMHSAGSNLTIFYPEKFQCTYSKTYEVTNLFFNFIQAR